MRSARKANPFNESTGTADPTEAADRFCQRLANAPPLDPQCLSISVRELFLLDYRRARDVGRAPGTLDGMRYGYAALERHLPRAQVAHPTPTILSRYIAKRRAEGVGNNTIRKELILYRCGLDLAADEGHRVGKIRRLPDLPLLDKKAGQASGETNPAELRRWLSDLQSEPRAAAILILLTGLRHEEATRLTPACKRTHWDEEEGDIIFHSLVPKDTKTRQSRRVGLTPLGVMAFRMAVPIRRSHRSAYKGASARQGIEPYIHDRTLRSAFGTAASGLGDSYAMHLAMGHGQTIASRYQKQDMIRLRDLARHVETNLRLTTAWLARAHMCRWPYARGRRLTPPEEG